MEADYPAAHSMAVTWFAVDAAGHVAIFETGLSGHVPEGVYANDRTDGSAIHTRLMNLQELPGVSEYGIDADALDRLALSVPPEYERATYFHGGTIIMCSTVGLYFFNYMDDFTPPGPYYIAPYHRVTAPEAPLHVDQLPPDLRDACRRVQLDVRFDQVERVQPMDLLPCDWREDRPVYICDDGKTVKPMPGREGEFARCVHEMREKNPELAAKLVFDGPAGPE
jgi:hypothetical protein